MRPSHIFGLVAACGLAACGGDKTIEPIAPTATSMVASGSFEGPMDAVSSPDGTTFFFTAHRTDAPADAESTAAVFTVPAAGGAVEILAADSPLEDPSGLLMSCDGSTLYVSDLSYQTEDATIEDDEDKSALFTIDLDSKELTALAHEGIGEAAGLAFDSDCSNLYVSGYTPTGEPALFTLPPRAARPPSSSKASPCSPPAACTWTRTPWLGSWITSPPSTSAALCSRSSPTAPPRWSWTASKSASRPACPWSPVAKSRSSRAATSMATASFSRSARSRAKRPSSPRPRCSSRPVSAPPPRNRSWPSSIPMATRFTKPNRQSRVIRAE